jgi:hypothetical protein
MFNTKKTFILNRELKVKRASLRKIKLASRRAGHRTMVKDIKIKARVLIRSIFNRPRVKEKGIEG